jgi:hypothetical protein
VLTRGTRVATVAAPWLSVAVAADTTAGATVLAWPGDVVRVRFTSRPVPSGARAGTPVGTVVVTDGSESVALPVRTTADLRKPTLRWRLEHG